MKIRSLRIKKFKRKNWELGIIIQLMCICYILTIMANYLTSDTNAYFYSSTEVTNSLQVGTWEVKKDEDKDKKYEDKNDSKNEDSIIKEQDGAEKDKTSEANQKPGEQDQFPESNNQTSEKESNNETDDSIKDNHIQEIQIDQSSKSNPTFDQNKTNSIDSKQN